MATSKRQKQALNTKSTGRLGVIVDPKENEPLDAQLEYLKASMDALLSYSGFTFVATILHDRDTNEDGTPKQVHIHAFIEHPDDGQTLAYWLDIICDLIDAKKNQVSLETSGSKILLLQYLRHDRKDKEHYKTEEIKTTNEAELLERLNAQYEKPKNDDALIQEALLNSVNLTELMITLGAKEANKYRALFKDIHQESLERASHAELEAHYKALQAFTIDLLDTLALTYDKNSDSCRLNNWRYWQERADKLDLY